VPSRYPSLTAGNVADLPLGNDRLPILSLHVLMTPSCGHPRSRSTTANAASGCACCRVLTHASVANALRTWNICRFSAVTARIVIKPAFSITLAALEIIFHSSNRIAVFQSQHDMVGTAVDPAAEFSGPIVDRVVEKSPHIRLLSSYQWALRSAVMKRRCDCLAVFGGHDEYPRRLSFISKVRSPCWKRKADPQPRWWRVLNTDLTSVATIPNAPCATPREPAKAVPITQHPHQLLASPMQTAFVADPNTGRIAALWPSEMQRSEEPSCL